MIEQLAVHRQPIVDALRAIDQRHGPALSEVNRWGHDLRSRTLEFTERGKLIRGALVAAAARALGRRPDEAVYTVAAALELVQSFLLIHDDIMDEDPLRRGAPAVFEQYRGFGSDHGYRSPRRFGESMGICAGDVAVLVAIVSVGAIDAPQEMRLRLISLLAAEIAKVGVAQMADVVNGHSPAVASEDEIVSVYRYKTGRYTFSLPLMLGAILAGADEATEDALSRWGELQGVVFQIRDDELGLMGDTQQIGKPAGSDIQADKQTLHRLFLLERIPGTEWADVAGYFGSDNLNAGRVERVRTALSQTGTIDLLNERIAGLRDCAREALRGVRFTDGGAAVFDAIDAYNAGRTV